MTLPKFVAGMLFVIVVVGVWSYLDSASLGVILLRIAVCALILQLGYFLVVCGMVLMNRHKPSPVGSEASPNGGEQPAKKLPAGRTSGANT